MSNHRPQLASAAIMAIDLYILYEFRSIAGPIASMVLAVGALICYVIIAKVLDPGRLAWRRRASGPYPAPRSSAEDVRTAIWHHALNVVAEWVPIKLRLIVTAISQPRARNGLSRLDTGVLEQFQPIEDKLPTVLGLRRCHGTVSAAFVKAIDALQAHQAWAARQVVPSLVPTSSLRW